MLRAYVARAGTWFDTGTVAHLICKVTPESALFVGQRDGKLDEEICTYDEFDIFLSLALEYAMLWRTR